MGKQYNKVQKRERRKAYLDRKKEQVREEIKKNAAKKR